MTNPKTIGTVPHRIPPVNAPATALPARPPVCSAPHFHMPLLTGSTETPSLIRLRRPSEESGWRCRVYRSTAFRSKPHNRQLPRRRACSFRFAPSAPSPTSLKTSKKSLPGGPRHFRGLCPTPLISYLCPTHEFALCLRLVTCNRYPCPSIHPISDSPTAGPQWEGSPSTTGTGSVVGVPSRGPRSPGPWGSWVTRRCIFGPWPPGGRWTTGCRCNGHRMPGG